MSIMSKRPRRAVEVVDLPTEPSKPSLSLLMKLGSIAVHVDEATSLGGHEFDWTATRVLLDDPEVKLWIMNMGVLLPQKRSAR